MSAAQILSLMLLCLAGCAKTEQPLVVQNKDLCVGWEIIHPSYDDVLTRETKEQIVHNNCALVDTLGLQEGNKECKDITHD